MINVYVKSGEAINLGREGTKGVRRVVFDFTRWAREYGEGSVQLIVMRHGDTAPYPVALIIDGEEAVWEVGAADTAIPGEGECEWQYFVGEALEKSETFKTFVENAMGDAADEAPKTAQGWVEQVLEAAARVETAVVKGPIIFADTWWTWDAEAEEYVDTGVSAKGESVTIENITESAESGGENIVTFSDGKTLTVKNGKDGKDGADGAPGKDGKTPVKGEDYFTAEDKAELVEQVIEEMPEPVTSWEDLTDKPFWEIATLTEEFTTSITTFSIMGSIPNGNAVISSLPELVVGDEYVFSFNGVKYKGICEDESSNSATKYTIKDENYAITPVKISFTYQKALNRTICEIYTAYAGTFTVVLFSSTREIKCLDEKYIPDSIARVEDVYSKVEIDAIMGSYINDIAAIVGGDA